MLTAIAFTLLGAISFRLRGSGLWNRWTRTGTIGGRLQWSVLMALAAAFGTRDYALLALVPAFYLGSIPPWFGDGLVPRTDLQMTANGARGVLWTAPAAVVLAVFGYPLGLILLPAGFCSANIYHAAQIPHFKPIMLDGEVVVGPGTELAELLFGAWIGFWLWLLVCFAS